MQNNCLVWDVIKINGYERHLYAGANSPITILLTTQDSNQSEAVYTAYNAGRRKVPV